MQNDEIRLGDVVRIIMKNRILILALMTVGLIIGIVLSVFSYARGEISKEYAVTSSIAVTSQTENGNFTGRGNDPTREDFILAEDMADSVMYVLRSDRLLSAAIQRAGLIGVTVNDIASNLELKRYNETQIIEMTLRWRSAEEGVKILSAINLVAPSMLIDTLKIGSVSVVNDPNARYMLGGNLNITLWIAAALVGMLIGIVISILKLLMRPTLLNSMDMEQLFHLEVLGEIPAGGPQAEVRKQSAYPGETGEFAEAYCSAAHILRQRLRKKEKKALYVTSSAQDEGKTTAVANLGVQLAGLEHKVLLVDCDVRNPSLSRKFLDGVPSGCTLNAVYRGETPLDEAKIRLTGYLDLLPVILEETELPLDDAFLRIVREASRDYEYVILDAAPVGRAADTMRLNQITDTVLFVVRYDGSYLSEIREAVRRLDKSGIDMVGCLVNGVKDMRMKSYGERYSYYRKKEKPASDEKRRGRFRRKRGDRRE